MKIYSCPSCEKISTADEWNEATRIYVRKQGWVDAGDDGNDGNDIGLIETGEKGSCVYCCPKCEHVDGGNYINDEGEVD